MVWWWALHWSAGKGHWVLKVIAVARKRSNKFNGFTSFINGFFFWWGENRSFLMYPKKEKENWSIPELKKKKKKKKKKRKKKKEKKIVEVLFSVTWNTNECDEVIVMCNMIISRGTIPTKKKKKIVEFTYNSLLVILMSVNHPNYFKTVISNY